MARHPGVVAAAGHANSMLMQPAGPFQPPRGIAGKPVGGPVNVPACRFRRQDLLV